MKFSITIQSEVAAQIFLLPAFPFRISAECIEVGVGWLKGFIIIKISK
jgi:hypothetical protein